MLFVLIATVMLIDPPLPDGARQAAELADAAASRSAASGELDSWSDKQLICALLRSEYEHVLADRSEALASQAEIARSQSDWASTAEPTPMGNAVSNLGETVIRRWSELARRYGEIAQTLRGADDILCAGVNRP